MNALWRRVTGTRTMRSVVAEFGPPPGARYATALATLSDLEVIRRGAVIVRDRRSGEAARDQVVAARARSARLGRVAERRIAHRLAQVPR